MFKFIKKNENKSVNERISPYLWKFPHKIIPDFLRTRPNLKNEVHQVIYQFIDYIIAKNKFSYIYCVDNRVNDFWKTFAANYSDYKLFCEFHFDEIIPYTSMDCNIKEDDLYIISDLLISANDDFFKNQDCIYTIRNRIKRGNYMIETDGHVESDLLQTMIIEKVLRDIP